MEKRYIGIDLGGTSMKMGIVDENGQVILEKEHPTLKEEGPDGVINRMIAHARELADLSHTSWQQIGGVGVGLPGFLDIPNGIARHLTNLGWTDVPIRDRLQAGLGLPVAIDNDANVAALGEAWCGAGAGVNDVVCITLGTGVGGGVIAGGRLLHGMNGFAGEIGHIQMDPDGHPCNCGQVGCLETISSATGMIRLANEAIAAGRSSLLREKAGQHQLSTRDLFEAASQNDEVAKEVIGQAVQALARALAMLSIVLNPARFIIGGGVSKAGDALFVPLRAAYRQRTQKNAQEGVEILPAKLGNRAGFIGAAGLIARREK
ncbi:ROK family glucokinase [Lihuaxuella thermophila]|uniref:Glucokinase n=1 Tax=Lihuaxuella thermophila TaxID=1173111 RepID=A0A1H8GW40_9BACL|nr:ROK family glucokinase [Lihuaxuella thermophila]SEN48351.1 glucokinase [Lihuaxuella thermophila]